MKPDLLKNSQSLFYFALVVTLVIRLFIASYLPLIGDEAYFILWAQNLDYGYYDHTPMVAWLLSAFLSVSDHPVWLRLPAILSPTLIGWVIYRLLRNRYPDTAAYAAIFYLLIPVNVVGVLILTDTPLVLWSFLSVLAFYKAQRGDRYIWYVLAGLFLGLAFYSKYFAALLGFSYLFYLLLFVRRGWQPYIGLMWLLAACLPFVILNMVWNYYNCWDNYLFNFFNRTQGTHRSAATLIEYFAWLLYVMTPPVIYYFVKQHRHVWLQLKKNEFAVFAALFFLPILLFLLIATWKSIGLHWLLSFLPMLALSMAIILNADQLRRCCYFIFSFSLLHVIGLAILLSLSPGIFRHSDSFHRSVVLGFELKEILAQFEPYLDDYSLATLSYSKSALLGYAQKKNVMVVGVGSYHGRQDDIRTDFRKMHDKNILIFSHSLAIKDYGRYFTKYEVRPLIIKGFTFYYALGQGFDYPRYSDEVLMKVLDSYYDIPDWLPVGSCHMYERYIFG